MALIQHHDCFIFHVLLDFVIYMIDNGRPHLYLPVSKLVVCLRTYAPSLLRGPLIVVNILSSKSPDLVLYPPWLANPGRRGGAKILDVLRLLPRLLVVAMGS